MLENLQNLAASLQRSRDRVNLKRKYEGNAEVERNCDQLVLKNGLQFRSNHFCVGGPCCSAFQISDLLQLPSYV